VKTFALNGVKLVNYNIVVISHVLPVFFTSATSVHCRTLLGISSSLNLQDEFKDTFLDSPVPNKSTISRPVNRFRVIGTLHRFA
jgi:hypothetical protein